MYDESIDMLSEMDSNVLSSQPHRTIENDKGFSIPNAMSQVGRPMSRGNFETLQKESLVKHISSMEKNKRLLRDLESGIINPSDLEDSSLSDDDTNLSSFLEDDMSTSCFLYPSGKNEYDNWIDPVALTDEVPSPYKTYPRPPLEDEEGMKHYLKLKELWELQLDRKRENLGEFVRTKVLKKGVHDNFAVYNPEDYSNIKASRDIKEIFSFITDYQSQLPVSPDEDVKMRPFIPDYYTSVGDIDAFIKVIEPQVDDNKGSGLRSLDEPGPIQSDTSVLDLQLRTIAKQISEKAIVVKKVENVDVNGHLVDKWIKDITQLHKSKTSPSVHYSKPMPDIDSLLQEWPPEVEDVINCLMKNLPGPEMNCDLATYADMICGILDIPVYKSKIQSLHVLFSLYNSLKEFKQNGDLNILNLDQDDRQVNSVPSFQEEDEDENV